MSCLFYSTLLDFNIPFLYYTILYYSVYVAYDIDDVDYTTVLIVYRCDLKAKRGLKVRYSTLLYSTLLYTTLLYTTLLDSLIVFYTNISYYAKVFYQFYYISFIQFLITFLHIRAYILYSTSNSPSIC